MSENDSKRNWGGARPNTGGKREGAGRKKTTAKAIGIRLPQEQVDWLKEQEGSTSSVIRELIAETMKK